MNRYYLFIIIFLVEFKLHSQELNFINSAKDLVENYYSKLDNIHDLDHPLSLEEIAYAKKLIVEQSFLKDNGKNVFNNISKTNLIETAYDPYEYLDYYIAAYEGFTIQHELNFIRNDIVVRSQSRRKVLPLIYEVKINRIIRNETQLIRTDTIIHNIIFKLVKDSDISDLPQIQNTEKYSYKNDRYISQVTSDPVKDSDKDGVLDNDDKCPNEYGTLAGCPDTDGDKVPDREDKCPTLFGPISKKGCPENKINQHLSIPLKFNGVQNGKDNSGVLLIKENQSIKDSQSHKTLFQGSEQFYGDFEIIHDRWGKQLQYMFTIDQIKFKDGQIIKLTDSKIRIIYDEIRNEYDTADLKIDLRSEKALYDYLVAQ